jgi:hypothetical protein
MEGTSLADYQKWEDFVSLFAGRGPLIRLWFFEMKATRSHCHGHLVYATRGSHDISTEKCSILGTSLRIAKEHLQDVAFFFTVELCQEL